MKVNDVERNVASILQPHHNHSGYPEEEDIIAGFHYCGWVEVTQALGVIGPAQGGVSP